MFGRLVQKELLHHLLDFRFVAVFALCALLSALGIYVGNQNHLMQLRDYAQVSETNRRALQEVVDRGNLWQFQWVGYGWNRRPEALSPVVYGLSGTLGSEVHVQYQQPVEFEFSLFETDPVHALFGVLDLAFIVKIILSLAVLLFTFDAVCGEKEGGTLRLYASFPVPRSTLALAKLVGSAAAALVPFVLACLLASAALALSPGPGLRGGDWMRVGALMGVLGLYLTVFAAFGVCASALTHRRMAAFLGLLGLWTVWLFVVPNLSVRASRSLKPVESVYDIEKRCGALRWEIRGKKQAESQAYWQNNPAPNWDALPGARRRELLEGARKIESRWDAEFYARLTRIQAERRNQIRAQQRLAAILSAISPLGAVSFASMDLARTGFAQQEQVENALNAHLIYLGRFIQEKQFQEGDTVLTDFVPFTFQDRETLGECLSRNVFHILNLALLAILGFAGAYVAILRYDVR
jgi:ABC-type transport system involved in multi-copper enzyme maturation permease subunit